MLTHNYQLLTINYLVLVFNHHLKAPAWHGTPNDVLVVLVSEVVATQLDTEVFKLLAEGDMVQHIRWQVVCRVLLLGI